MGLRFLAVIFVLLALSPVCAIQITEVMYDYPSTDDKHEWIEIFNNETEAINLTGWKFFEANTNHNLVLVNGSFVLQPNESAVIVQDPNQFKSDNSEYNLTLIDSSFSLSNSGEYLVLKNSSLEVFENMTYDVLAGAAGDGNSLQLVDGNWCSGEPTPGKENKCSAPEVEEQIIDNTCDLEVSILLDDLVFNENESIEYKIKVENKLCDSEKYDYDIKYSIRSVTGDYISSPRESEYEVLCSSTKTHTKKAPSVCGTEAYKISAEITYAECKDKDESNNEAEQLIAVKGSNCTSSENKTRGTLNEILVQNNSNNSTSAVNYTYDQLVWKSEKDSDLIIIVLIFMITLISLVCALLWAS